MWYVHGMIAWFLIGQVIVSIVALGEHPRNRDGEWRDNEQWEMFWTGTGVNFLATMAWPLALALVLAGLVGLVINYLLSSAKEAKDE